MLYPVVMFCHTTNTARQLLMTFQETQKCDHDVIQSDLAFSILKP